MRSKQYTPSQRRSSKVLPTTQHVSDPLDESCDGGGGDRERWILYPSHQFRVIWDAMNLVLLAYVCTVVPYVSSFYSVAVRALLIARLLSDFQDYQVSQWVIADNITDMLYALDIVIMFRSAYVDPKTGDVVSSPRQIAAMYVRGWLGFDVFATFPWDTVFRALWSAQTHATQLPRLLRVLRLTRIAKVLRVLKVQTFVEFCEDKLNINRNYIVVSKLLLCILFVAHFTACGFYFIGTTINDDYAAGMAAQDPSTSWIAYATFAKHIWQTTYSKLDMYISSLYFAFTMMATVGFGDFVPVTITERMFTIVGMVVSAGTYAFMIASVSSSVASMNVTKNRYFERLNELNAYMESRGLPGPLQLRTRRYYRYFLQRKTVYDESRILEDLSSSLREEITDHYIRMTIKNITFFQDVPKGFTAYIAVYLKPLFLSPHSTVLKMGEYGSEMFIVARGVLQVFEPTHTPDGEEADDIEISFLFDGDHFGEMALLLEEQQGKRTASVRAKIYCELHGLEYKHLQTGLTRYPSAMDKLMGVALHRKCLVTNLRKTKITNLITSVQKKTIDKRFKKLAAEKRFQRDPTSTWGLPRLFKR
ncbi:hypothetical protein SDRG_04803 [Saprolegnia diclina VS20]|uniref:Cyclic nucleotide-binding domain-containing protein n=1 Tax=Saprolegnia diclina (strain VS20) TaxID=1156394 RepID=T0QSU3_SAPDV|nr:hypothetical protein SDRG_04803 [Saprolegnia diclina VS20]EQC37776.1 hypothetical protein SDRG_04803 [Saprolegnia diclina VS20]|eukprot:XP_008608709.1 hypothetical protein SDRG_04803 [Saprolegnia diclina VS20]